MTRTKRRSKQPYQIQGVDALLGESSDSNPTERKLALEKIQKPSTQPRRYFDEGAAAHPERETVDNVIHSQNWQQLLAVFRVVGKLTPESFRTNRLPLLKLSKDILEPIRQGKIEYTKAKAIARVKDQDARDELMLAAIADSLSLREIKERIKEIQPQPQKEEVFVRVDHVSQKIKKSQKILRENPRKRKKLESLLAQIEKLFED